MSEGSWACLGGWRQCFSRDDRKWAFPPFRRRQAYTTLFASPKESRCIDGPCLALQLGVWWGRLGLGPAQPPILTPGRGEGATMASAPQWGCIQGGRMETWGPWPCAYAGRLCHVLAAQGYGDAAGRAQRCRRGTNSGGGLVHPAGLRLPPSQGFGYRNLCQDN